MFLINNCDWATLEALKLSEISEDHLPINRLSSLNVQLNFVQNRISDLEDWWVYTLANQWGDVHDRYGVSCNYTVTLFSQTSDYPSFPVQVYPSVPADDVDSATSRLNYASGLVGQWASARPEADEYVPSDNPCVSAYLTRVYKVVDDIYSTIVQHMSVCWQKIALLRRVVRTIVNLKSDLLEKLSALTEFVSIVVSQATWFVCHGFHPPAQVAKGN